MDADQVAHLLELEDRLSKVRAQVNSGLENQKRIAITLTAVEENIKDLDINNTAKNLVNYVVAFISLLDQAIDPTTHNITDTHGATSAVYLLDIVLHYVPKKLLKSKFAELLTKFAPCITDENTEPLLIKSAIGCLESLLIAQDAQAWNNTNNLSVTPTRGLQGLLELTLDPRPKIRKKALEALHNILYNPPVAPTSEHIAAGYVCHFTLKALESVLQELSSMSSKQLKNRSVSEDIDARVIHVLKLVSTVILTKQWQVTQIEPLCGLLLEATSSPNQYLITTAFECFENLFNSLANLTTETGLAEDKYARVLEAIYELKPAATDTQLSGSWMSVIAKGMATYASLSPLKCIVKIPQVFQLMSAHLQSEIPEVSKQAAQCLIAVLTQSVSDKLLLFPGPAAVKVGANISESDSAIVTNAIEELSKILSEFLTIRYTHCAREIMEILATAFRTFKFRSNPAFVNLIQVIDSWRVNDQNEEAMELQNEMDTVFGSAIVAMGPEVILQILPLNLVNPGDNEPGRAWLLPLLRDYTKHARLSTFIEILLPIIKHFESQFPKLKKDSVQLRIFQTVVDQLWSTLPHFANLPVDLRESFTDEFASELCSLLYSKLELRTTICNALKMLVESNLAYSEGAMNDDIILQATFPVEDSKQNLEYLSTKATNILAVLFNVYTQTSPDSRGYILDTIESYFKITSPEDLEKTFNNVCGLLKNAMDNDQQAQLVATLLDIVISMIKYLPQTSYGPLFMIFGQTIGSNDTLVQKRSYRIISKLSEVSLGEDTINAHLADIEGILLRDSNSTQVAVKSGRLNAIKTIIGLLPPDHLNFIVQVIAEVVLATKDVSEKTRQIAFETLVLMGKKMQSGGVITLGENQHQPASIDEFFKVLSAGLIGESQHMVSSTITAFACLMFEFRESLSPETIMEIYDTIELYLTSNSREIVKSAIGFSKVCVLGLPEEMMKPKIPELLPKLLRWSHEHSGHFKAKIKHIIERLIRRFGYDYIEQNFPEGDKKLLANIRKIRNRNKRKGVDEGAAPGAAAKSANRGGPKFMSALDEALYGSSEDEYEGGESEGDNDDFGDDNIGRNNRRQKQYIVEKSGADPLDLLDAQALSRVLSSKPRGASKKERRKMLQDEVFSFDSEGKLIINDKSKGKDEAPLESFESGINAYLEAVKTGPIRGQKNRLKFKKGQRHSDNFSDDEGAQPEVPRHAASTKNRVGKHVKKGGKYKSKRKL